MTTSEFSNEFDLSISEFAKLHKFDPDRFMFDEYEKSKLLTQSQEQLIINTYFGGQGSLSGIERNDGMRRYFNNLVKTWNTDTPNTGYDGLSVDSVFYQIPLDVWFVTYEQATLSDVTLGVANHKDVEVIPVKQDEYHRIKNNPFRKQNRDRILRFDCQDNVVELISDYSISEYLIRYISKPPPIILVNLPSGVSINGISVKTECVLNPMTHRVILDNAIELALSNRGFVTGS